MSKIFAIIILIMLSLPVIVQAEDNVITETSSPIENRLDDDIVNESTDIDYKEPISKRKIVKKFLIAMGSVVASSLTIYFMLTIYNRVRENFCSKPEISENEPTLESPDDMENAVKTFLDKTNW
ncbi:MAG: hypothetical protein E7Z89_04370 [Cyanobacteria bacterium SIG28]|nr:hypothetical protein [Cyanobacteria bacterium SIG28]